MNVKEYMGLEIQILVTIFYLLKSGLPMTIVTDGKNANCPKNNKYRCRVNSLFSITEPGGWSSDEDSKKIKELRRRLHDLYAKYKTTGKR
jgi:hypothetical protein